MSTATRRQARCVATGGESIDGEGDAVFRITITALYNQAGNDNILPDTRVYTLHPIPCFGMCKVHAGGLWYDSDAGNITTLRPDRRYNPPSTIE
jgi:hypothetical protein